jgi:16S rRNA processing protein RimM
VRGEVLIEVLTDFPERLQPDSVVYVGEKYARLSIRSQRYHNDGLLLSFAGMDTPEEVGRLRNQILYVPFEDCPPLPKGEYYHHQMVGLSVLDEKGTLLGTLTEVLQTGANDVYVVAAARGGEILLPVIPGVILDVDLGAKTMKVHLPDGLLDETGEASDG